MRCPWSGDHLVRSRSQHDPAVETRSAHGLGLANHTAGVEENPTTPGASALAQVIAGRREAAAELSATPRRRDGPPSRHPPFTELVGSLARSRPRSAGSARHQTTPVVGHAARLVARLLAAALLLRARYLMSVRSLNIGRYIEMTIVPTMTPTPIMRIGSMIEVRDWMLASTSSS